MKMYVLLTVLQTFPIEIVRSICLNIMTCLPGDHFVYSHHLNVSTSSDDVKRNFDFITVRA